MLAVNDERTLSGRAALPVFAIVAGLLVGPHPAHAGSEDRADPFEATRALSVVVSEVDSTSERPVVAAEAARPSSGARIAPALAGRLDAPATAALTDGVRVFYAARENRPLWFDDDGRPTTALEALVAEMRGAGRHALPASRYAPDLLVAPLAESPAAIAEREIAATEAYLAFGTDLASGILEPREVDREIKVYPERPSSWLLLEGLAGAADPAAHIAGLAPRHPDYAQLVDRLQTYRRLARTTAWAEPIGKGRTLRPGDRSDRVEALRRRLIAMGDLVPAAGVSKAGTLDGELVAANETYTDLPGGADGLSDKFDTELAEAVARFQGRHGLNQDGIVGPATLRALNASPTDRVRQIAVNLERLRWLNRDLGNRHVMVNLAGFEMALVEDGAPVFTSRVVIGKSRKHRTPEFSDEMEYMVINPRWYVPASIAREEILPKLRADPGYLAARNMRLIGADVWSVDWQTIAPSQFPGRIEQGPGRGNALGRVKFMFPNSDAIYLHDTPARSLFNRDVRAYSHGCVRVQKPLEFAHALLSAQSDDPEGLFDRHLRRGREKYVHLDEHVPVHLTYRTAWVDEAGLDQFRTDVYGRDRKVFQALGAAGLELFDG